MTSNLTRRVRSAAAVAVAAAALAVPAASVSAAPPSFDERPPKACYDVVGGSGAITRERTTPVLPGLPTEPTDAVRIGFQFDLAAPSCQEASYRVQLLDDATGAVLLDETRRGDGSTQSFQFSLRVEDYAVDSDGKRCFAADVFASMTSSGVVWDEAPDAAPRAGTAGLSDVCENGGGGNVGWQ